MADVEASNNAEPERNVSTQTPEPDVALTTGGDDSMAMATAQATHAVPAKLPEPEQPKKQESEPPAKRARMTQDAEGRNRQRRLFGVLTKTLNKFQEDTKKESESSKRRAAVEERLAAKLREEKEKLHTITEAERAKRNLRFEIIKKEDERNAFVAIYRSRRAAKLNLANFLCTKSDLTDAAATSSALGNLKPAPLSDLPHALPINSSASSSSHRPLYYLPYKLLPWQADKIDGQIEDMRLELDKEDEAWEQELRQRDDELRELKEKAQIQSEPTRGNGERSRHSRDRRNGDASDDEDSSALPGRAPLPEREERMDEDTDTREQSASQLGEAKDGDSVLAGTAEGEDVVECE